MTSPRSVPEPRVRSRGAFLHGPASGREERVDDDGGVLDVGQQRIMKGIRTAIRSRR